MPNSPPTAEPAAIPATGDQRRSLPVALRCTETAAANVTAAQRGAAAGEAPATGSFTIRKTIGITVTGRSMITVPVTTGVRMRCRRARRSEKAACTSPVATTSVASSDGPPSTRAATQTAM